MDEATLVVVGAGALGAAAAWTGAQRTDGDVLVLDRGQPCSGTSPRGAGLVDRLLPEPLDIGLVDHSLDAFRRLSEASGSSFAYHDGGGLLVVGPDRASRAEKLHRVWRAQGLQVLELAHDEVRDLPGGQDLHLAPEERVWFNEGDGWCVTTDAVNAMLDQAQALGARVLPNTPVERVDPGRVTLADGGTIGAEAIVVAAGVWTPALLSHAWPVPVRAYRPQAASVRLAHRPDLPILHDLPNHLYLRPDGPGRAVAGDGTVLEPQDPVGEPPVEPGFDDSLAQKVARRFRAADEVTVVRSWGGFEAGTPDRCPLVGPVPGMDGVHVLVGGNGFGFMRSPALGEAAARLALGEAAPLPIGAYGPGRFGQAPPTDFRPQEGFALE